jgi:hypothetical protein
MSDALQEFLASGNQGVARIDADILKLAGQRAASAFLSGEHQTKEPFPSSNTLTHLVAKEAAAIPGIQNEHIKRMCEFTNHIVHDALFQKQAAVKDGSVVYVQFNPADPVEVIKQLNDGTKVAHVVVDGSQDYMMPPPAVFGQEDDALLQNIFLTKEAVAGEGAPVFNHPIVEKGTTITAPLNMAGETTGEIPDPETVAVTEYEKKYPRDKLLLAPDESQHEFKIPDSKMNSQDPLLQKISEAAVSYPRENPHAELFALRTEVEDNLHAVRAQAEDMEARASTAWDEFYGHVKQAMYDGDSFGDVSQVCYQVCQGNDQFHEATVQTLAHKLMADNVASAPRLDADLEKMASAEIGEPNPENPLVKSYAGFCLLLGQQTKLASWVGELEAGLKRIDDYVRGLVPGDAAAGGSL